MRTLFSIVAIALIIGVVFFNLQTEQSQMPTIKPGADGSEQWSTTDSAISTQGENSIDYIIDISVANIEELDDLLTRAENIAKKPSPGGSSPGIALVLHGPEIEFFNIDNYSTYKTIVDRAAKLDAFNIIDVRMCETMMQSLNISPDKVPAFIELVPFGPTEVERLKNNGAVVL